MSCVILFENDVGFVVVPLLTEQEVVEQFAAQQHNFNNTLDFAAQAKLDTWIIDSISH